MQSLFEWDFYNGQNARYTSCYKGEGEIDKIIEKNLLEFGQDLESKEFVRQLTKGVFLHKDRIDKIIQEAAPEWPLEQITAVDRNVLRLGLYELLYAKKDEVPPKVAINEAIELAKSFGGESSGRFVNGVLGTVFQELEKIEPKETKKEQGLAKEEILASGVILRKKDGRFQVAMVNDAFGRWVFPKGHKEEGETLEQCVLREAKEEVGLDNLKIIAKLGEREYFAHEPEIGTIKRRVTDFLLESESDTVLMVEKTSGIKDGRWIDIEELPGLKQYHETKDLIDRSLKHFNQAKA